jgi:Holliday junction resolvasome RuvABC endonuclease subunit
MALPKILFLDLATRAGWCVGAPDETPRYGTKVLPSTGEDIGRFAAAYNEWLLDMITLESPGLVVFEAPILAGRTNLTTARKLTGLAWHTEFVCNLRQVRVREHHLQSIKKMFAGSGRADKDAMIAAARRLGFDPKDDNQADALGGWCCTVHERAPHHSRLKMGALGAARFA